MKKQKVGLYIVALVCFFVCMGVLNLKYDPFYRINGINNETRQLILNNLTEEEQDFLIENAFPVERFLKYLQDPDFHMLDLEYYERIEQELNLKPHETIIYTNQLLEKIRADDHLNEESTFNQLISAHLQDYYLKSDVFDMDYISFYEAYIKQKEQMEIADIEKLNTLCLSMDVFRMSAGDKRHFIEQWCESYRLDDLIVYMEMKQENPLLTLVENPESLTTVISENQTIASYEPTPLVIPYDVSRLRFGTYLRQDANAALEELTSAATAAVPHETLLLVDGYRSYNSLQAAYSNEESTVRPGCSEEQLGLTIDLMVLGETYGDFQKTEMFAYLQKHSWEFGFIQRYADKTAENYSPNIYRFVGKDAAKVIHDQNLTLEAYEGVVNE